VSPVAQDVFADFTGTGKKEWHTVLIGSAGAHLGASYGHEIFAMDVTNPFKPSLLWHIVGSDYTNGNNLYPSIPLTTDSSTSPAYALKWFESHAQKYDPTACASATTDGCLKTGLYDYSELGTTRSLSIGQTREGTEPRYSVFIASDKITSLSAGPATNPDYTAAGVEVFAIDVATGQKQWQWEQIYTNAARWDSNTASPSAKAPNQIPPEGATLLQDNTGVTRVLVPDLEGRVWELDPTTGANHNRFYSTPMCNTSTKCSYPLVQLNLGATGDLRNGPYRQPITTNVGLAKLPTGIPGSKAFTGKDGQTLLVLGTGGWDLADPYVTGGGISTNVVMTPITDSTRAATQAAALKYGMLPKPVTLYTDDQLFYGPITIAGSSLIFGTTKGKIGSDVMNINSSVQGGTYLVDLGSLGATKLDLSGNNSLGVGDLGAKSGYTNAHYDALGVISDGTTTYIVGNGVSSITETILGGADLAGLGATVNSTPKNKLVTGQPSLVKGWMQKVLNP
jgi:type IV pilus assembly protein PilY1